MYNKTTAEASPTGRSITSFVAVTLLLGSAAQLLAIRTGLETRGRIWLLLAMWAPAISAFSTGAPNRQLAWAALKKSGWRFLGHGLTLGFAPTFLKTLLLAVTGSGQWDSQHFELSPGGHSLNAVHHLMLLGSGPQSFSYFGLNLTLSITVWAMMVALTLAIGEEVGWRGVLQPSMEARYSRFRGTLYVGVIWAFWHLPLNLKGYNDSSRPFLNALLLFPIALVAFSFVLAWLTRASGSVWPAALAHGANNTISPAFLLTAKSWGADSAAGLIGMLLVVAIVVGSTWRTRSSDSGTVALPKA